ncbi:MAG: hypothetical protein DCE90_07535 [Pseudanabaena sp.]|nr:MAG: hypothetical protein DCE90_07535 [Pseudanabaena sp.]
MATPRSEKPEKRRRKKKQPKKFRLSYSLLLLLSMIVVGSVMGLFAYSFGKQALEGVNPSPSGIKLPKINPNTKTPESPKPSPKGDAENKSSFFLNESELVAEARAKSQLEIGMLTRPSSPAKTNISDRKRIYTRVDRAFNSMRDPLAVSASADQRIAERIAALRQRVYSNERISRRNVDRGADVKPSVITPPMPLSSSSQWEDRETPANNAQVRVEIVDLNPKPASSLEVMDTSVPINEINRR